MSDRAIQEMRESIEQIKDFDSLRSLMTAFEELRDRADELDYSKEAEEAQYDIEIVALGTKTPFVSADYDPRFRGVYGFNNGSEWPDVSSFDEQQIKYYESRLEETTNLFLRARYADFLFEYRGSGLKLSKFALGQILSKLLLETASAHLDQVPPRYSEAVSDMARAIHVAVLLNNPGMLSDPIEKLLSLMNELSGKNLRWVWEISLIMRGVFDRKLGATPPPNCYEDCATKLDEAREYFWNDANYSWHRYCCEELVHWAEQLHWEPNKSSSLSLEIGESYEAEAVHVPPMPGRHTVQRMILDDALRHYKRIGSKDKIEEIKIRIREANRKAASEYWRVPVKSEIPDSEIEAILQPYRALVVSDCLTCIGEDPSLLVDFEQIRAEADKQRRDSPFMFSISHYVVEDDRKVVQTEGEEDSFESICNRNYRKRVVEMVDEGLTRVFDMLCQKKGLTDEDLITLLRNSPSIDKSRLPLIEIGLERFFNRDYVSALHVLVPQFEGTLRMLFQKAGYDTTSIREGITQFENSLSQFLEREEVKMALDPNHHKYFQMVMVEQSGFNLRNRVAHGLIKPEECNERNLLMVLHLFLILTHYDAQRLRNELNRDSLRS